MLVEGLDRADGFQDSHAPSTRADGSLCIATASAALPMLPSDNGTARREHRWRDHNNCRVQKRRLEACVATYLRGLRTVRTQ
jgi:hypothetical protein